MRAVEAERPDRAASGGDLLDDRGNRETGGDLARVAAADAVGDDAETESGVDGKAVFVHRPNRSAVGDAKSGAHVSMTSLFGRGGARTTSYRLELTRSAGVGT